MILESKDISAISFVGSTPIAKFIYENAKKFKRVQALGGAKNHLMVMPDANLDQTVDGIMVLHMDLPVKDVWQFQLLLQLEILLIN